MLDYQLIGFDCDMLLKSNPCDKVLIRFIKQYFGKSFIIGKIITLYIIPMIVIFYIGLSDLNTFLFTMPILLAFMLSTIKFDCVKIIFS